MSSLLSLPIYYLLAIFILSGFFVYCVGYITLLREARQAKKDPRSVLLGPFMGTVSTAWALSLGFVAADIWALNSQADRAISKERSAIYRLMGSAHPDVLHEPDLEKALRDYRRNVFESEWGFNKNITPSRSVEVSLLNIRKIIMTIAKNDQVPQVLVNQAVNDFDELQDARNARLATADTSVDQFKWYMLLFLTVITAITVAAVHADRVRAGKKALLLYVVTATTCLWLLTIHANPYMGIAQIDPSSLFMSRITNDKT